MTISNTRILNNALFDVAEHTYSALERNVSGFLFKNLAFGLEVFVIVFRQVPCVPQLGIVLETLHLQTCWLPIQQ